MITGIKISDDQFSDYSYSVNPGVIENLTKVNILIGPNNSGKSRFMRNLFTIKKLEVHHSDLDLKKINSEIQKVKSGLKQLLDTYHLTDYGGINNVITTLREIPFITPEINNQIVNITSLIRPILGIQAHTAIVRYIQGFGNLSSVSISQLITKAKELALNAITEIEVSHKNKSPEIKYERIYIPILRGLRPIQILNKDTFDGRTDSYRKRTAQDYFSKTHTDLDEFNEVQTRIHTGLNTYEEIRIKQNEVRPERDKIDSLREFLKLNFFNDQEVTLTPQNGKDVLLVGIGDEEERLIYELGDGIQAIILILYPIFLNKGKKMLFFIEEPELYLHPGMQRILLDVLAGDEFKDMQFFITTHSNHFLDLTFDKRNVSIYSFHKGISNGKFEIKNVSSPENEVLKNLGILNSSVFLSNCTIWVEGITDRIYIKKFLELHLKHHNVKIKFKEDLHYSFVEYAGSNITHWNFDEEADGDRISALRLNNNIFLIVDSDVEENGKKTEAKTKRQKELKNILKDKLYITEGKEIENALSPKIIKNIVALYEEKEISKTEFKINIEETINSESFNLPDLQAVKPIYWKTNLGKFIDENLNDKLRKVSYADGNTISSKQLFCERAVASMNNYDDLSDEAKNLCEILFKFIESCNK